MSEICEKISTILPRKLSDIHNIYSSFEENLNLTLRFLHREHIEGQGYYYFLLNKNNILYLYFKGEELKYFSIFTERPVKKLICERDL
jgi:hypothetical protein